MLGAPLRTLHILNHFNPQSSPLNGNYFYSHFPDEENKAQCLQILEWLELESKKYIGNTLIEISD